MADSELLGLFPLQAGPQIVAWTSLHLHPHRPWLLGNHTGHYLAGLLLLCRLGRKGWGPLICWVWSIDSTVQMATLLPRLQLLDVAVLLGTAWSLTGLKKEKLRISTIIYNLEEIIEGRPLLPHGIVIKNQSNAEIAQLLFEEEIKRNHRAKSQFIFEWDTNTRYFHSAANGRH
jgi:hypothetical protein